ncbi:MAG TPA: DUF3054 domain-containing protein [Anaerolineales bacterium]|nr:DUF3054 domain-containing protein [Anaerolineales bacterium]
MFSFSRDRWGAAAGDVLAIAALTLAGFNTHGTLTTAGSRIWATFLPLVAAWILAGIFTGVYDPANFRTPAQLWRPVMAMVMAAPMFGLLRAWVLGNQTISVIFVIVIGSLGAVVMFAWRGIYALWILRRPGNRNTGG